MIHLSNIENCQGSKTKNEEETKTQHTLGFREDMLCPKCYAEYLQQITQEDKGHAH